MIALIYYSGNFTQLSNFVNFYTITNFMYCNTINHIKFFHVRLHILSCSFAFKPKNIFLLIIFIIIVSDNPSIIPSLMSLYSKEDGHITILYSSLIAFSIFLTICSFLLSLSKIKTTLLFEK